MHTVGSGEYIFTYIISVCFRLHPVSGLQALLKVFVFYVLNQEESFRIIKICSLSPGYRMCDEPAPLGNGYRIGHEFWEGKNVTYRCNKGYWIRGPFVRVCNDIGNWTEEEPTCEGKKNNGT